MSALLGFRHSTFLKLFFKLPLISSVFFVAFVQVGYVSAGEKGSASNPVTMMFVPSGESQVILKGGEEIALALKKSTGLHIKASIATSYAAVVEAMGAGKVDIGWLATLSYVLAKDKYEVDLMLIVARFGSPFYRGQVVVRADSGIQKLSDLKGKRFAFVDPASTSGHLYPKTLLLSNGADPDTFFARTVFAGSHNAVILSVMKGEVDGGATYDDARAAVVKSYPDIFDQVKVIAYTKDIPNDTVSARRDLDPVIRNKIKQGLMDYSKTREGSRVLKRLYGISGLMDFDAFFDPVRDANRMLNPKPPK